MCMLDRRGVRVAKRPLAGRGCDESRGGPGRSPLPVATVMAVTMLCVCPARTDEATPSLPPPVFANGDGLPPGAATAASGEAIYLDVCAGCHGRAGEGASALELVGDRERNATDYPDRGVAAFWPYAPPLFDYIRRAMPPDEPWSLTADETYAVTGWVLVMNGLAEPERHIDAEFLAALRMPNVDDFRTPASSRTVAPGR